MSDPNHDMLDDLLSDFLDESDQLLTQLNANLLQLDQWVQSLGENHQQPCDQNLLNEMFRSAHSLKGLSGMLGLTDINQLTHKLENVFDAARHDRLSVTGDVTELMFMGLDQLTAMIGLLKEPGAEPVDCDAVLDSIRRVLQAAGVEREQTTQAEAEQALTAPAGDEVERPTEGAGAPPAPEQPAAGPAPVQTVPAAAQPGNPLEGIDDEDDIPANYLAMFVGETDGSLDAFSSELLALEDGGGGDLKRLLGIAHKIKGSAASVGLHRAAKAAHLIEDLLEDAVATGSTLPDATVDVLLTCTDGLRRYTADLKGGKRGFDALAALARELIGVQAGFAARGTGGCPGPSAPRQVRPSEETFAGLATYAGQVTFEPDLPMAGLKAELIYEKLARLGKVHDCLPAPEQFDAVDESRRFRFRITTDESAEAVAAQLRLGGVLRATVEPLDGKSASDGSEETGPAPTIAEASAAASSNGENGAAAAACAAEPPAASPHPPAPEPKPSPGKANRRAAPAGQRPAETLRVDTDRLDQLMDLAGQLVINRARFSQIGARLKGAADCNHAARALDKLTGELDKLAGGGTLRVDGRHLTAELESVRDQARRIRADMEWIHREVQTLAETRDSVRELFEAIHQLDRVSDGIQKSVMDIRMVPIGPLFSRFQRVVRDISRAGGKQIKLAIAGEKTELDKRMIDELGDPLVHLVRNAADHGIEPPDEREAAGKPRQGTVGLNAFHRGNSIVIEVCDDGKGLDAERLLRKALDKGLITEADSQRLTNHQIYQLIWNPGLSTAEKVTDVSGRGMGMDIVKTKIDELSGTVDISSEPGKGTTITIKLPLTLAILPSLMVDIAGGVFAIPLEAVKEIVSAAASRVRTVQGRPMATVWGRVVPMVRLGSLLTFHTGPDAPPVGPAPETTLVVVHDGGRELALAVDRVIGEEDVVIKSIAENYRNIAGIAGATILGDGRVSLILDVPALIPMLSRQPEHVTC